MWLDVGDATDVSPGVASEAGGRAALAALRAGDRLAAEGVNEFMFVLGQARLKGAVQMIINPVAMW